jgi:trans-2,3-dihydro-3-hydroxyanthranilate isomerase
MKTKPTRFSGWAGKNLADSLATRRRPATTAHGTGDGWEKHIVRIEALPVSVKPAASPYVIAAHLFCIVTNWPASLLWHDISQIPGTFMSKSRRFVMAQWDVFSSQPLEGNSLAVFSDARGLSDAEMQSIAKEMNLSETTFILPRDAEIERERGVRVRIFTVQEELPFAGHPTLGTAFALRGDSGVKEIALELNVGQVPVRFEESTGQPVFGEMTQIEPVFGMKHDREAVARAIGLREDDFDASLPIETVSTGIPYTIVPLRSLPRIQKLRVDLSRAEDYMAKTGGKFFYFVTRETVDPVARLHARMLFYNGEDPATGSAAGCTAAWMVAHAVAKPDERVRIEQGIEMQRPSRIFVRASQQNQNGDNRIVNVRVGGNAIEVMRAEVFL